jgi:hypothetical protein
MFADAGVHKESCAAFRQVLHELCRNDFSGVKTSLVFNTTVENFVEIGAA